MWLKMLTLMFLTGTVTLASVRRPDHIEVFLDDQQNNSLHVSYGATLTLYCCLNVTKKEKYYITWLFNMTTNINVSNKTRGECPNKERAFNLTNVNESHSGWYFCKVTEDIPTVKETPSRQTQIVVSENLRESTTYPSLVTSRQAPPDSVWSVPWWIWIIVGVSSFILLTLLVTCLSKRGKCSRKRAVDPIYANTHNCQPSPQPRKPADSLKTASTYQNLRTPRSARKTNADKRGHK